MKKLLGIVVLGLFLCNITFGSDIPGVKVKKLKCLHNKVKNPSKEDYLYILFSDDDKSAKFVEPLGKGSTRAYAFNRGVYLTLYQIKFGTNSIDINWFLDRKTGALSEYVSLLETIEYGKCEPLTELFDPHEYMKKKAKENLDRVKKEINF